MIYHSHTATEAYPSRTDIGLASEPGAHYVLVSTREHGNSEGPVEFRSYRIIDGEVTEEEVDGDRPRHPTRRAAEPAQRERVTSMAIEVRIPTILRTYTGGEKSVEASGATLSELIDDLESNHPGIKDRLSRTRATCAASSTSTSTTRTCASPAGSAPSSPTATRSSCCRPSPGG